YPAADRESRRRPPTGRSRSSPKGGRPGSDTATSRCTARQARDLASQLARRQSTGVLGAPPAGCAEPEDDFPLLSLGKLERNLDGAAGIQACAHLVGQLQ